VQIYPLALRPEPVLELARHALADMGRAEHGASCHRSDVWARADRHASADHADRAHDGIRQLPDDDCIRSRVSGGEGWRRWTSAMGLLHVRNYRKIATRSS
jgi:hypothetical protein